MVRFFGVLAGITAAFAGAGYAVTSAHRVGADATGAVIRSVGDEAGRRLAGIKPLPVLEAIEAPEKTRARDFAEKLSVQIDGVSAYAAPAVETGQVTRAKMLADTMAEQLGAIDGKPVDAWMASTLGDTGTGLRDFAVQTSGQLSNVDVALGMAGATAVATTVAAPGSAADVVLPDASGGTAYPPAEPTMDVAAAVPDAKAQQELETLAAEQAAADKKAAEKAEAELLAAKAETEKLAAAGAEKAAMVKAEADKLAAAASEKAAMAKVEAEKLAAAEVEKAAMAKAEAEKLAAAEVEKAAMVKAEAEKLAAAADEKAAMAKAEAEQLAATADEKASMAKAQAEKLAAAGDEMAAKAKAEAEKLAMKGVAVATESESKLEEQLETEAQAEKPPAAAVESPAVGFDDIFLTGAMQSEISGRAPANTIVTVFANNKRLGDAVADTNGTWRLILPQPTKGGEYALTAVATTGPDDPAPLKSAIRMVTVPAVSNGKGAVAAAGIGADGGTGKASPTDVPSDTAAAPVEPAAPAAGQTAQTGPATGQPGPDGEGGIIEDAGKMASALSSTLTEWFGGDEAQTANPETAAPADKTAASGGTAETPAAPAATKDGTATAGATMTDPAKTDGKDAGDKVALNDKAAGAATKETSAKATGEELSFSSVRFTPRGNKRGFVVASGRGPKGETVKVLIDDKQVGSTRVTSKGRWLLEKDYYLAPGKHAVRAEIVNKAGTVVAQSAFPFEREGPAVAEADASKADAKGNAGAVVPDSVVISAVRIEPGESKGKAGSVVIAGKASPGTKIEVAVDGNKVGEPAVAADGGWTVRQPLTLAAGSHSASVRTRDIGGTVVAQHAFGFTVPEDAVVAQAPAQAPAADAKPVADKSMASEPAKDEPAKDTTKVAVATDAGKETAEPAVAAKTPAVTAKSADKPAVAARSVKRRVSRTKLAERVQQKSRAAKPAGRKLAQARVGKRRIRLADTNRSVRAGTVGKVYVVRGDRVDVLTVGRGFVGDRTRRPVARLIRGDWYRVNRAKVQLIGGPQTRKRSKGHVILAYSERALRRGRNRPDLRLYID